ncbi:MAG: hypothetical protein ABI357_07065 [Granulicella sp.]
MEAFRQLFVKYKINSVDSAWANMSDSAFRKDMYDLGHKVMQSDGGKITLVPLLGIIGAALGGVGIAMLGGAFGLPLALVLALVGLIVGNEADSAGYTSALMRKVKAFWEA